MKLFYVMLNIMLLTTLLVADADVQSSVETSEKKKHERPESLENWHFYLTTYYTPRSVKGSINRYNSLGRGHTDLLATGKSLDLDKSNGLMYSFGTVYKKWTLGFTYMPSQFEDNGNGKAYFSVTGAGGNGIITQLPTKSKVDINMYLANVLYEVVKTDFGALKLGIGVGKSEVKFNITPNSNAVNEIAYDDGQPFGFVTMNMANRYKKFSYSINVNGINMDFQGVEVKYTDFTVMFGYNIYSDLFNADIIGGYRQVNFALEGDDDSDNGVHHKYDVDLTLTGPFIGLSFVY